MATNYVFEDEENQYLVTLFDDGKVHFAIKDKFQIPSRWSPPIKLIRTEKFGD